MSLPDRTLCWVEGPPWDRECTPVVEHVWGVELVDPKPHHRGPRLRVRGRAVDENVDEGGEYVDIEREEFS